MAPRSLLVVMVAVVTTCSLVLAERVEEISETETRSITIASHGHMLTVNQSDDVTELSGERFYTCCLKGYSNKMPTVEMSFNGVKKKSTFVKMMTSSQGCVILTSVPASSCHDDAGEPDEKQCETTCIQEFSKYQKYHQVIVDDQQKEVQYQQKVIQNLNGKHDTAKAEQTKAEQLVKDLEGKLADAQADLKKKIGLVQQAQSEVQQGEAEMDKRQGVLQQVSDIQDQAEEENIPSECGQETTCCCLMETVPIRVDVNSFVGWKQCKKNAAYPPKSQRMFSKSCGFMQECHICREKMCSSGKMKGIC